VDFNSKKFWVAQAIAVILTAAMFLGKIEFSDWWLYVGLVEAGWATVDTAAKFATKKNGGTQ